MAAPKHLGLYKVIVKRTTIRNEAGSFFIGSLFEDDYFYAAHEHAKDSQWVWGYGGKQFKDFGWVRLEKRFAKAPNQKEIAQKYEQKVHLFLKHGGHKNRSIAHYASAAGPGLPPPKSKAATGLVKLASGTPFYLNHSHGAGMNEGWAKVPAMVVPSHRVSWRYFTKDNMHAVVYHPLGYPVKGHGKWGFIRNDQRIASIELYDPKPTRVWVPGKGFQP